MGRILVKAKIWNFLDEGMAEKDLIKPEEIRKVEVEGLVDSGATLLTLPEELVRELGLTLGKEVEVPYGDNGVEKRRVAFGVKIELLGREALTHVLVEKPKAKVLIGQIVLEALDLVIDPKRGILTPRPGHEAMPLIEVL